MHSVIHPAFTGRKENDTGSASRLAPFVHDLVFGANDGIVTTFAIVSGVAGANLSAYIVLILGFANVLADGLSMGLGNYLSIKSKQDNYRRVLKQEYREIEEIPESERQEIREIFSSKGFSGTDLEKAVEIVTSNKQVWAETMMREEHGMAVEDTGHPFVHGIMTFAAFLIFGSIPIVPYLLPIAEENRFRASVIATAFALLLVGLSRSYITKERMLKGPAEILAVGSVCAIVAYGVGVLLRGLAGGL